MRKFTIFKRLALGYLLILLFVIALGVYATSKLEQLSQMTHSINSTDNEIITLANRLRDSIISQRGFEKKYIVSKDIDFYMQFLEGKKYIQKDLEQIAEIKHTMGETGLIDEARESYENYSLKVQEEVLLIRIKKAYPQERYEKEKEDLIYAITNTLEKVIGTAEAAVEEKIEMSAKIGSQASRVAAGITIVSVLMAILIAFFNARTVSRPISLLIKETREIAMGKFEKHLTIKSPSEINELGNAFNHMRDRLRELDDMKADLISNISHELKTPLAVIREAVGLQLDSIAAGSVEKQSRLINIIEEECERLINSVNKILELSRMEAGMMDYQMEKCFLSHLIEMSVSKVRPIAERKDISLVIDIDDKLPHGYADAEKIAGVLDNLLGNALKFTPEKGNVSVRAYFKEEKTLGNFPDNKNRFIEISISDTGPGIPGESINGIFDKFKKLDKRGTGLGLHIAKQIVTAHGGDIWVKSERQKGSTFFFTVPVY